MRLLTHTQLDELAVAAAASPRRRAHLNLHASAADPVQRFFVAAMSDTYIRPHRHRARAELAVVVRGRFDIVEFDEAGVVTGRWTAGEGAGPVGYEAGPMVWHTLVACTDGATFLEIKEGPYDPAAAAEFAAWAPAEGHAAVPAFRDWLRRAQPGDRCPGVS